MLLINKKYIMFDDLSYMNLMDGTVGNAPFGLVWFSHNVEKIDTDTLVLISSSNYKRFLQDSDIDKLYLRALSQTAYGKREV